jgi:hypothetical protein
MCCVVRIAKVLETARPSQSYSRSCQCKFSPRCTQRKIDVSNFQCNTLSKKKSSRLFYLLPDISEKLGGGGSSMVDGRREANINDVACLDSEA